MFQVTCRQLANQIDISVWNLYLKDSLKSIREKKREWCCNVWRTLIIAIRITARRKLFADGHLMGFEQTVYFAKYVLSNVSGFGCVTISLVPVLWSSN